MTTLEDPIVIVGSARTPMGGLLGVLKSLSAPELGAIAIKAAIERAKISHNEVAEAIMGNVLSAGIGQAPARQAAILSGIPNAVPATTINKMCGSGMKAVMLAHDLLQAMPNQILIAGGMESMTNAPYLLDKARAGYRFGHGHIKDHALLDGLEDAYDKGKSMGFFAEMTAEKLCCSRETQDEFALHSLRRAQLATKQGTFKSIAEIVPVVIKNKNHETLIISDDELPLHAKEEKIAMLKPSFKENGSVTAANSSSISDGAAALVLMPLSVAQKKQLKPLAKILGFTSFAGDPRWFTLAPIEALKKLYQQLHWTDKNVDLYEINEAFAIVIIAAMQALNIPHEKINVHGGACALGHPIGASGARIICTLLGALIERDKTYGIATLCIGGGEATAIAIERIK